MMHHFSCKDHYFTNKLWESITQIKSIVSELHPITVCESSDNLPFFL